MDYTVHGILQARMLEWVAIPFSRASSEPRDQTQVSRIAGKFFTVWATREALLQNWFDTIHVVLKSVFLLLFLQCTMNISSMNVGENPLLKHRAL